MQTGPQRVVALGASNLTRGFPILVSSARTWSGPDVEVLAARLAARHGARFVGLRPEWYGFDPVHVRPGRWGAACREILGAETSAAAAPSVAETLRLHALPPERQWLFGVERVRPQRGARLADGGHVWLY